jgi:hypothetical protein
MCAGVCAAALAACGGGGGGGGSGGNTTPPGGFTLSPNSLSYSGKANGPLPASQTITVHLSDSSSADVGVGYKSGVAPATWLGSITTSGAAPNFTFTIPIATTALAAGTYTTTLTVGTANTGGAILQTQGVQVTYTLINGLAITTGPLTATTVIGDSQPPGSLAFTVTGPATTRWTARSTASWLVAPSGTQQGPGNFMLGINVAGLAVGSYPGNLTITNAANAGDTATLAVTLNVISATLSPSQASVTLGGASGLDLAPAMLGISLNTHQNAFPWTVTVSMSAGGNWLQVTPISGSVSGTTIPIRINAARGTLATGTYTGQLLLQATVDGAVVKTTVPVTLNIDVNRLLVNATGVAFSNFPSRQVLTRTLNVANTWGISAVPWQASADQSWLIVTPSGTTGSPLQLTANPGALAPGQYIANVTVSSTAPGVTNQETVRVGLTVGATDPTASIDVPNSTTTNLIVPGPVEPVVFVNSGTRLSVSSTTALSVYDVNSGALLRSFNSPFANVTGMAVSGDGLTLYVLESTGSGGTLWVLDPTSGAVQTSYALTTTFSAGALAYLRPDAHPVIVNAATGDAFDLAAGSHFDFPIAGPFFAVGPSQQILYTMNDVEPSTVTEYSVVYSTLPGVGLGITQTAVNNGALYAPAAGTDLAVSADGSEVFVASGSPPDFGVLNGTTLLAQATLGPSNAYYPNNAATSWNGLFAGGINLNPFSLPGDILVFNAAGTQIGSLQSGMNQLYPAALRFSGDGARLISGSGTGLRIQSAPPPQ